MKDPQWHGESFFNYNQWLMQQEFDDVRAHVKATEAAIRAGNRGLVPGAAPIALSVCCPCLNFRVWWRGGIWMVEGWSVGGIWMVKRRALFVWHSL